MDIESMKRAKLLEMKGRSDAIEKKLGRVRYKVGVYSGKGGVGKTTIAVNLAVALAKQGKKVGFLDADIDCPNAHVLFGIKEKAEVHDGTIEPIERYGVKIVSMHSLIDDDSAVMWRGPMISKAIGDLLTMGNWGDIDYLIIDMPPGTSDAPITMMQLLAGMTGFIGVTTPQPLSAADLQRSISMISSMNIPLIGIVENMCSDIFGCSGKDYIAHIPMLKEVPDAETAGVPATVHNGQLTDMYNTIINAIEQSKSA